MDTTLGVVRSKDDAASFVQNRLILGDHIEYDSGKNMWVEKGDSDEVTRRLRIWEDAHEEMEALVKTIRNYQEKMLKRQGKKDIRATKWTEALGDVHAAVKQYENVSIKGPQGFIKKGLSKLQRGSKVMEHWCGLLPGGDYGGTIAGVFSMVATVCIALAYFISDKEGKSEHGFCLFLRAILIFEQASGRVVNVKACIFEAIEDVPDYIDETGDYLAIYRHNRMDKLEEKSAELCKAILILFRLIMENLTKSSGKRGVDAFLKGDAYEKRLEDSKKEVERLAKKMRRVAKVCDSKRKEEILGYTREIANSTKKTEEDVAEMKSVLVNGYVPLADIGKCIQALLESNSNFNVNTGQALLGSEHKTRRHGLFNLRELQLWLSLQESRDLLIHGNKSDAAVDDLSTLSLVCAELVRICSLSKDTIVASHFCGLHSDYDQDERAGFAGMLASLIGQLIQQSKAKKFRLDRSCVEEDQENIRNLDLECLCSVFEKLVQQLPKDKIFYCVLDGISLYKAWEYGSGVNHAITVFEMLYGIVEGEIGKESATVKLLMICPGDSLNIGSSDDGFPVEAGEVLVVPEFVDGDRQGVWETEDLEKSLPSVRKKRR
ncbi:hypothetical protein SLS56_007105 [Neofusicoccum ribis]|uniref:Nephrocystin 3-like N-terminal domain-containing protein n=1 Tax=Neofusicoccum ribis TaxID=45134 RepID=A0ABR3SNZ2_9PEZI